MIPWFIVHLVAAIVAPFGFEINVRAWSHGWGAERIYLVRSPRCVCGRFAARPARLRRWDGRPLQAVPSPLATWTDTECRVGAPPALLLG